MAEEDPGVRPSLRNARTNWRQSELPFFSKLPLALCNNWIKLRTRQNCCGNLGQPGC